MSKATAMGTKEELQKVKDGFDKMSKAIDTFIKLCEREESGETISDEEIEAATGKYMLAAIELAKIS